MAEAARRPVQERAQATRRKLVQKGIGLFAERGYAATTTRQVEAAAGVQRNLINYHFGSKEEFWKACVDDLFGRFTERLDVAQAQGRDIDPLARLRFFIRAFLRASALFPEVSRVMLDEGKQNDWRLEWIVEHHVKAFFRRTVKLFDAAVELEVAPAMDHVHFHYILTGGAVIFAMAPEFRLLTGLDACGEEIVDAHADALANLLIRS